MKCITKEKWQEIENIRRQFVEDFCLNNIKNMGIEEYVVGNGNNKSFCKRLEYELKELGEIRGARADKYKVYYGKTKNDKTMKYRYVNTYSNGNEAFDDVKKMLIELIEYGDKSDCRSVEILKKNKFCPTVKGKILYVYYPNKYLPIYSKNDLITFVKALKCYNTNNFSKFDEFDLRNKLKDWKNESKEFKNSSMMDFTIYLYENFKNNFKEKEIDDRFQAEINEEKLENIDKSKLIIGPTKKTDTKRINDFEFYPRSKKIAMEALARADYKCEYCNEHKCFLRKKDGKPYTEVHHLIPLGCCNLFENSLDNLANIVSLCSNCHNEIHYGKDAKMIIEKLYQLRKDELKQANLSIDLDGLLNLYK